LAPLRKELELLRKKGGSAKNRACRSGGKNAEGEGYFKPKGQSRVLTMLKKGQSSSPEPGGGGWGGGALEQTVIGNRLFNSAPGSGQRLFLNAAKREKERSLYDAEGSG